VQMRKKASLLSLVVFAVFLGIVIFHPFSHGLHHDGDDGHDCPICLWVHNNTVFISPMVSLLIFFMFLYFYRPFVTALPVYSHFTTQSSRAPPF
jgi:hypothetical protein